MHKNAIWIFFLIVVAGAVTWFVVRTSFQVSDYLSYDSSAVVKEVAWSFEEIEEDLFQAKGTFFFQGKKQTTLLEHPRFRNRWSAEKYVESQEGKTGWRVWFRSRDPSVVTLQKSFPLKECVSAGLLIAILFYFIGLGMYVGTKYRM